MQSVKIISTLMYFLVNGETFECPSEEAFNERIALEREMHQDGIVEEFEIVRGNRRYQFTIIRDSND